MKTLKELKQSVVMDGKIDADEVVEIKKVIYTDGRIDTDEADFLFELNDACSGAENHSSWAALFADAICSYLLEDEKSPGEVDQKEADWLLGKIQGDGKLDSPEKKLLEQLSKLSKRLPDNLKLFIEKSA